MNLFIERIRHPEPQGAGFTANEQELRTAMGAGQEFMVEAGKRTEFEVPPGSKPVVYLLEGSVRFEGDDTSAMAGDVVWFRAANEKATVGIEADARARGVFVSDAPRAAPHP